MTRLRAWCGIGLALALAACANTAPQDGAALASNATATQPRTVRVPPTGGPQPPVRHDNACKVDADCKAKPHCQGTACRCVDGKCIAARPAVDPVVDPVPPPPPET